MLKVGAWFRRLIAELCTKFRGYKHLNYGSRSRETFATFPLLVEQLMRAATHSRNMFGKSVSLLDQLPGLELVGWEWSVWFVSLLV